MQKKQSNGADIAFHNSRHNFWPYCLFLTIIQIVVEKRKKMMTLQ